MQTLNTTGQITRPVFVTFDEPVTDFPKQIKWTSDEYYRLADLGFFQGKHVELIEGEIVTMAPMGSPHVACVGILNEILSEVFAKDFSIRIQAPLDVNEVSQPEPDVGVVRGTQRDHAGGHPKTLLLAVEVSDSTLSYDRNIKSALYAEAGIEDYWIANLKDGCLEVYRKPVNDPSMGFIYSERTVAGRKQSVSPLAKPKAKIKVADILP